MSTKNIKDFVGYEENIDDLAEQLDRGTLNIHPVDTLLYKSIASIEKEILENNDWDQIKIAIENDLKKWISRVFTYQFDYKNFIFKNLNKETVKFLKSFDFKNRMFQKHLLSARTKNNLGKSAFLVKASNKKVLVDVVEILGDPVYSGEELQEIFITKNEIQKQQEIENINIFRLFKKDNKVIVDSFLLPVSNYLDEYTNKELWVNEKNVVLDIEYIPVVIDLANEDGQPEWENVSSLIDFYGSFDVKKQREFEYVKTQLNLNPQNSDKNAKQIQENIEKGRTRIHEDYNEFGEQSLTYLSNGGITVDIAIRVRDGYKEEIKEQLFLITRTAGGNNKHTTEAVNDNVNSYSYTWIKKSLFAETIAKLYWIILDFSKRIGTYTKELPDYLDVDVQLSRPLEILLNLNADGEELDNETMTINKEDTNGEQQDS